MNTERTKRTLIGRYQLIDTFGEGSSASIHRARDSGSHKVLVIKEMNEDDAKNPERRARFIERARTSRRFRRGQLATVLDIHSAPTVPFLVLEYYPLGSLTERLLALDRPLRVDEGLGLATALAAALDGMHHDGLGHGNLTPDNCLLAVSGARPTIELEPGATVHLGPGAHPPAPLGHPTDSQVDLPPDEILARDEHIVLLNPGSRHLDSEPVEAQRYLPPEHRDQVTADADGSSVDGASASSGDDHTHPSADVFSASAMVVAAIAGVEPHPNPTPTNPPFADDVFALTGPLEPGLRRGLSLQPALRQPNIAEWQSELVQGVVSVPAGDPPPYPAVPADPPPYPTVVTDPPPYPGSVTAMVEASTPAQPETTGKPTVPTATVPPPPPLPPTDADAIVAQPGPASRADTEPAKTEPAPLEAGANSGQSSRSGQPLPVPAPSQPRPFALRRRKRHRRGGQRRAATIARPTGGDDQAIAIGLAVLIVSMSGVTAWSVMSVLF